MRTNIYNNIISFNVIDGLSDIMINNTIILTTSLQSLLKLRSVPAIRIFPKSGLEHLIIRSL